MWNKANIQALLDKSDRAVMKGLCAIYDRQTASEQCADRTTDANGVGFGAFDAEFCSSLARQVRERGTLSAKQIAIGRNKIKRYWRQLAEIANESGSPSPSVVQPHIEPAIAASAPDFDDEVGNGQHAPMYHIGMVASHDHI